MASFDRQDDEPKVAYQHFTLFRDMGPSRSLPKLAQHLTISLSRVKELSAKYGWAERADQYDAHLEKAAARSYVTEIEKQARQRAAGHRELFARALYLLKDVDAAKLSEIAAAMKVATDGMRVEAGLATAKVEHEIIDVRAVLDALPTAVSREIRSLLEGDAEPGGAREAAGELPALAAGGAERVH